MAGEVAIGLRMSFDAVTSAALPSSEVTALHLLRHPHVDTGGRRLAYGHLDLPLSERGLREGEDLLAFALARLPRPDGVLSSDLQRCLSLAEPLAAAFQVPLTATPALREQAMGDWEGQAWEDLHAADPAGTHAWWDDYVNARAPGGENLNDLVYRVEGWREARWEQLRGRRWLVVTHIGVIRVLSCRLLGLPYDQALRFAPARASHTLFLLAEAGAVLEVLGERPPPAATLEGRRLVAPHAWEPLSAADPATEPERRP